MKSKFYATSLLAIGASFFISCSDVDSDSNIYQGATIKPESEYFDFSTSKTLTFDLQYGSMAANTLLEVYAHNPFAGAEFAESPTSEADFKIFADENGAFRGAVEPPSYTDSVWVVANGYGLPYVTATKVVNGKVSINTADNSRSLGSRAATRSNGTFEEPIPVDAEKKLYAIVKPKNKYGQYDYSYNSSLFSDGNISYTTLTDVQKLLEKNKHPESGKTYNYNLAVDASHVNTTIATSYTDKDGETRPVTSAKVYFTFLHERAVRQSTLGYYYYKSGEVPVTADDVEKFIIIPNASLAGNEPYSGSSSLAPFMANSNNANSQKNKRIQLLFRDPETGKLTEDFPAGYTIGYFFICNGWSHKHPDAESKMQENPFYCLTTHGNILSGNNSALAQYVGDLGYYFSNDNWHDSKWGKRFMALNAPDGQVIYGMETSTYNHNLSPKENASNKNNGADLSMNDILFSIDATPSYAIQDPDRPTVDHEEKEIYAVETNTKIYAFEDVWPNGGDYDLNDVIVKHKRTVTFGSNSNKVTTIVDEFTPVQEAGAAANSNTFAVQYPGSETDKVEIATVDQGIIPESDTRSFIITTNTNANRNKTFKVTRTFKEGSLKKQDVANLDPYIITTPYTANGKNRTEVHMPKHKATSRANQSQIGQGDDAYYVDKNSKYPFAISIRWDEYAPQEGKRISEVYPGFNNWVATGGHEDTDWYKKNDKSK